VARAAAGIDTILRTRGGVRTEAAGRANGRVGCTYSIFLQIDRIRYAAEFVHPHGVGAADKRTAFYPGSYHGWQLVESATFAPRARALVLRWIKNH
jgi:hypothetical protein